MTAAVLQAFGSPQAALRATAAELRAIPHIGEKIASTLATALRSVDIGPELQLLDRHGVTPVPLGFPDYPPPLASVIDPPPLLYLRGDWRDSDRNAVAIVGSRSCTSYGKKAAADLARGLTRAGFTVISGLARGIDGAAHRGALDGGGRTIAVLAGGLANIYPPEHRELADEIAAQGGLISETPMTVAPQPGMFPARNRIISALSRAVVVVEANSRSGALITADHALSQGREVFAVPGNVDSPASAGCLELLRNGARLVRSAEDVIEDLQGIATTSPQPPTVTSRRSSEQSSPTLFEGIHPSAEPPNDRLATLNDDQRRIYDQLDSKRHSDELVRETGVSVGELSRLLMQLEMKQLVRRLPGNYYERR